MKSWWGHFNIAEAGSIKKQIGPLSLVVRQEPGEWRIYYDRSAEWLETQADQEDTSLEQFGGNEV